MYDLSILCYLTWIIQCAAISEFRHIKEAHTNLSSQWTLQVCKSSVFRVREKYLDDIKGTLAWGRPSMVDHHQKIDFHCFVEWFNRLSYSMFLHINVIQSIHFKKQLNNVWYFLSKGRFMENFRFDTICNITQEPQKLQSLNCISFTRWVEVSVWSQKDYYISYLILRTSCCRL